MKVLSIYSFRCMLNHALEKIKAREKEFSQLDAIAGDGDHGTAIVAAMNATAQIASQGTEFKTMLMDMAMGVMEASCGSTSTLLGAFFLGMSDKAEGEVLDVQQTVSMFQSGLQNVRMQTQAQVGGKTMMDALIPAIDDMQNVQTDSISDIFQEAAKAAHEGAQATINMQASFGRARNLGERSIGHADPGASSWACMFEAFAEAVQK